MKVKDIMTTDVRTCAPDTTVAEAAHLMGEGDCGFLPVVDEGELVGVVTDRDMYIALATKNERASLLRVGAVATTTLATCVAEDDLHEALATMRKARVRRLPVVGYGGSLLGVLSVNDVILATRTDKGISNKTIVEVLQEICVHHHPAPHIVAA